MSILSMASALTRLPLDGRGKVKIPRPPTRATIAARRAAHHRACAEHLALYPKLPCTLCSETEAVAGFLIRRLADDALPLAVPLCFSCRQDFEKLDRRDLLPCFLRRGIDANLLAQSLRYRTGELRLMKLAIEAHRRTAVQQGERLRLTLR